MPNLSREDESRLRKDLEEIRFFDWLREATRA
ncbi:MAG: hypothetical protein ACI8QS_002760 [Planctomycetota bacterium]